MKVAVVQLKTDSGLHIEEQFHKFLRVLEKVENCDVVVFPELWLQGAFGPSSEQMAPLDFSNRYLNFLIEWAKEKETWICTGSFLLISDGGHITNTCYFIDPEGRIVANYSKRHLFGYGSKEAENLVPGNNRAEPETSFGKVGFAICYDMRFPEHFRASSKIPELFVIPSAWPISRINHFESLSVGRAIENQCYVIACNGVGAQGTETLGGNSIVVDFNGQIILKLSSEEEIGYCELNFEELRNFREQFDVLSDRVKD